MIKRSRSSYEIVIIVAVVVLGVVMSAALYAGRSKAIKSNMLVEELSMIRSAIITYRVYNRSNPHSIEGLLAEGYDSGEGGMRPYLSLSVERKGGRIIDPFGNAYAYDPVIGWVSSTTTGYERW